MGYQIGNGYEASDDLQTSIANAEIIPPSPTEWSRGYSFYKLSFFNDDDCHVIINNDGKQKYLRASQGFSIGKEDQPIISLKIIESGITFNWFGAY